MAGITERSGGSSLIRMTFVLLSIYNLITIPGIHFPQHLPAFASDANATILSMLWIFSILEFFGAASLFVDLIGRWDRYKEGNVLVIILAILLVLAFFYKTLTWFFLSLTPDYS